ncbi:glutaredoxin [Actinomyces urogenitalis DSM 15434]|jgi:glutaredoxin-like protein|uniref:Glutaredoxin n=2 Tax=Actinomyces urogenitalis TaxID=103621 RepID=C0W2V0_9ACTO|nr:glutaredoxin domain-containing protein [Actinomyces urogenitalis]ETJ03850.1 MAG: Glutaredoxin family protein [Actinomyces urogenitalis DORA_12]EEH66951.1 glutaredoxin [Actinomyces urogenitalis DSM 15434]MCI7457124.1 NrdH-redoxin [Actinomyces urogenitalis]MDK8238603.1 glutaredoxin domain-containing protein [Actinomyces urogenitalis]MDK8835645.1 glutaredoxin domain-containing protein [Actinomyces urogenitalis]
MAESTIEFYGAQWCGDCRMAKRVLEDLQVPFTYHDLEKDESAVQAAIDISGQKHIPVIQFSDGTFLVEPSKAELTTKVKELGLA